MNRQNPSRFDPIFDYNKAFYDLTYATDMEDMPDQFAGAIIYPLEDDDIEFDPIMTSLNNFHLHKAYENDSLPRVHDKMKPLYKQSNILSPNEFSETATHITRRFLDMFNETPSSKSQYNGYPTNESQLYSGMSSNRIKERNENQYGSAQFKNSDPLGLCKFIYKGIVGLDSVLTGPFGTRKVIYCDYVASGKPLQFIEQFIKQFVLPMYANTHSDASDSAVQTNKYREDAREIIRECVNGSKDDIVIFTGSGSTSAISKIIQVLKGSKSINVNSLIIMVAAYEHHSNLLPWENINVSAVVKIDLDRHGRLDLDMLDRECRHYHSQGFIIIGSISAASNVTGVITDTERVSEIIHKYDGYSFFDFACAAPYVKIDMNPSKYGSKDAIFISVHKFVGGPQTPGLLIAKKFLFKNVVPTNPAGGTVEFVSRSVVYYTNNPIVKEEGGTPEIIGSIRAGLVLNLKRAVTESYIHKREQELVEMFFAAFANNSLIKILGSATAERLAIFSFVVFHPDKAKFIHHNFISLLLNDLFGIQSRPGCACAGPYAMELLNIPESIAIRSAKYFAKDCIDKKDKLSILKQGFVRINLPYFYPQEQIDFIIQAVQFVVKYGWHFLPQYKYATTTGFWMHRSYSRNFNSLKHITYSDKSMNIEAYNFDTTPTQDPFENAYKELQKAYDNPMGIDFKDDPEIELEDGDSELQWFLLPHEAAYYLHRMKTNR